MLAAMRGDPRSCRALAAAALLVLAGCGFGLAGCAGGGPPPRPAPPPPPSAEDVQTHQRLASAEALCQQLAADPALGPLRGRLMAPSPRQPWTREMMIDNSRANERDRDLLVLMDERRAYCRQAMLAASPAQTVPLFDYWTRQDAALVKLFNRESTVGTYNRAMADATAQFSIDVTNLQADVAARANNPDTDAAPSTTPRANAADVPVDRFRALARVR
jgi:hypothetical protein